MHLLPISTPSLVKDYLANAPNLQGLYAYAPSHTPWQQVLADRAQHPVNRPALVHTLREQLAGLALHTAAEAQLEKLLQDGTFTVCTGQQAGLAGGPLYTWYKALSTVLLAEQLQAQFPDQHFVPIFWVASEDHDAAEVNHVWAGWNLRQDYAAAMSGAVGRHNILQQALPPLPAAFAQHYRQAPTWGRAFQSLLQELLGPYGMLVLDADHPTLKQAFIPIARQELTQQVAAEAITQANAQLAAAGYKPQLHHRDINLFYLQSGQRSRIIRHENGQYATDGGTLSWTADRILAELAEFPERFSPNAALRPVYQEAILPNIAYIGGNAELAYWLQLRGIFTRTGSFFPPVLPRISALAVSTQDMAQIQSLDTDLTTVLQAPQALRQHEALTLRNTEAFQALYAQQTQLMEQLGMLAAQTDVHFHKHVDAEWTRQQRFWHKLSRKLDSAAIQHHPGRYERMMRLQNRIQPHGLVQERVLGLPAIPLPPQETLAQMYHRFKAQGSIPTGQLLVWEYPATPSAD